MLKLAVAGATFLSQVSVIHAAYCNGSPDEGIRTSDFPIFDEEPTFVRSVKNAALYEAGPANARFPVVHVYGNAYEVGYAQGLVQKEYLRGFISNTYEYFVNLALEEMGDSVPKIFQEMIILGGLNAALDWAAEVTAPFTPQEFYDELHGLSDSSGIEYQTLLRLNMYPELTKAQCSFLGAWGEATSGHTFQLRSLDFDTDGPFKEYPQVTVYHPTDGGHPFMNMGWPGTVGLLTGLSSSQIGISEIGVSYPDDSFGQGTDNTPPQKVQGEPWMFVLRDVAKYQDSLEEALDFIENADRTCNLIIGLGDGEAAMVNGIEYSGYVAVPYSDQNLLPQNSTWHPVIEDVVYNGMDWNCPNYDIVLAEQLQTHWGSINEDTIIHNILPTVQTGDLHIALYDLTETYMHVSFMRKADADQSEPEWAYERQFTRLHGKSLFALEAPVV
jgi:isopenicillin-N N-acyltransferase-like protein